MSDTEQKHTNKKWFCYLCLVGIWILAAGIAWVIGKYVLPDAAPILAAVLVVTLLGLGTGEFLRVTIGYLEPQKPAAIKDQKVWEKIYRLDRTEKENEPCMTAGAWVGLLERIVFLAAFWRAEPIIIGGWLALKVAAKWEVWKNLIQVPDSLQSGNGKHDVNYFATRSAWGGWLYTRFLLGTLANIVIALVGYYVGENWCEILMLLNSATANCPVSTACSSEWLCS